MQASKINFQWFDECFKHFFIQFQPFLEALKQTCEVTDVLGLLVWLFDERTRNTSVFPVYPRSLPHSAKPLCGTSGFSRALFYTQVSSSSYKSLYIPLAIAAEAACTAAIMLPTVSHKNIHTISLHLKSCQTVRYELSLNYMICNLQYELCCMRL